MKRQWFAGAWAFLGAPALILLVGYYSPAQYIPPPSRAFIYVEAFLPGVCMGLGLLALLSLLKRWPQRAIVAAAYGAILYVLALTYANPIIPTHAEIWVPK